jgi:hypothetical protein
MWSVRRFLRLAAPLALQACASAAPPSPALTAVSPAQAYNDTPVPIQLTGLFRPSLAIDTASGAASLGSTPFSVWLIPIEPVSTGGPIAAGSPVWSGPSTIDAVVPADLPALSYDVELRDPRGQTARLEKAYTSLGSDAAGPALTIQQLPAAGAVSPGASVSLAIDADPGMGQIQALEATVSSLSLGTLDVPCALADHPGAVSCPFTFTAPATPTPAPVEVIQITATARNAAGAETTASLQIEVALLPTLISVTPTQGSTAGQTVLTVVGANFIDGLSQILIDGQPVAPGGGTAPSEQLMTGTTVPHAPGKFPLVVTSGAGQSAPLTFEFIAQPQLRVLDPTSGPESLSTFVTLVGDGFRPMPMGTVVEIDDGSGPRAIPADVQSAYLIDAVIPPGTGVVSVFVSDPISGASDTAATFSHSAAAPAPDGGG